MNTALRHPLPPEYKRQIPAGPIFTRVNDVLREESLNTICVSGKCPNRGECFSRGSLAFMILGDVCTRHCGFCAVKAGNPGGVVDTKEPQRLARAAATLKLNHAVITAVARDDLKDGGAAIFAECIRQVHATSPSTIVEVLTSDFMGDTAALDVVLDARPEIFNHNIETVERLTPRVRSKATYRRTLDMLRHAKRRALSPTLSRLTAGEGEQQTLESSIPPRPRAAGEGWGEGTMKTKSGLMLGLGETKDEILQTLKDLRSVGCDYLTMGQYLQPSAKHLQIQHFVPVDDFKFWRDTAYALGFERVASGPLVRSSYFADALHDPRAKETV